MLLDVVRIEVKANHILDLEFENGERRRFDMTPYMKQKPWSRLNSPALFESAYIHLGTVSWPGGIDIDPETLYELSQSLEPQPA